MAGSRTVKIELKTGAKGVDPGLKDAARKLRAFERQQTAAAKKADKDRSRAARAADRENARLAKKAARDWERSAKEQRGAIKGAGDGAAGIGHGIVTGLAAAAGMDIGSTLADAARSVFDVEKELTRLGIDANLSSAQMDAFRDQMMQVSNATGVSRLELVKAAHAYQILTGDAQGAIASTKDFADVAIAAGAAPRDIAEAAASMRKNLNLDPKDFRKGFDVLLNLGHKGALELRDFAGEMSGLAPQFKQFGGGDSLSQLTELGAAMETVKLNFKDASETATGLRQAMTSISKTKVAERLSAHGVEVWRIDPKTKAHVKRDFFDIIADIKKKIPDEKVLADVLGGRQESLRAITAMLEHYDEMVKLRREAANSDQVSVDSHRYLESATGRIGVAWERIKNSIAAALTPDRIEAFATEMERAAKFIGDAAGALDYLLHGPKKEAGTNMAAGDFATAANVNNGKDHDATMAEAKAALAPRDPNSAEAIAYQMANKEKFAYYGGEANYQAGARKAIESEGLTSGYQSDALGETNDGSKGFAAGVNHGAGAMGRAQFEESMRRAMTAAFNESLARLGITVKADGNAIAKTASNADIHRGAHR